MSRGIEINLPGGTTAFVVGYSLAMLCDSWGLMLFAIIAVVISGTATYRDADVRMEKRYQLIEESKP